MCILFKVATGIILQTCGTAAEKCEVCVSPWFVLPLSFFFSADHGEKAKTTDTAAKSPYLGVTASSYFVSDLSAAVQAISNDKYSESYDSRMHDRTLNPNFCPMSQEENTIISAAKAVQRSDVRACLRIVSVKVGAITRQDSGEG